LGKLTEGQQKIKIVRTNQQSNFRASCQSIFSLRQHHPIWLPRGCSIGNRPGERPENQIFIPDWTYFHCPGAPLVSGYSKMSRSVAAAPPLPARQALGPTGVPLGLGNPQLPSLPKRPTHHHRVGPPPRPTTPVPAATQVTTQQPPLLPQRPLPRPVGPQPGNAPSRQATQVATTAAHKQQERRPTAFTGAVPPAAPAQQTRPRASTDTEARKPAPRSAVQLVKEMSQDLFKGSGHTADDTLIEEQKAKEREYQRKENQYTAQKMAKILKEKEEWGRKVTQGDPSAASTPFPSSNHHHLAFLLSGNLKKEHMGKSYVVRFGASHVHQFLCALLTFSIGLRDRCYVGRSQLDCVS